MLKQELIKTFYNNHKILSDFIHSLTDEQFVFSSNGKWTAGQQFSHVYLTLQPFLKVLPSKDFILEKFGKIDRPVWSYDTVIENYFKTSRQAPAPYLPEPVNPDQKSRIAEDLEKVLLSIQELLNQYTEEELDTLVIPHPLLGKLTIREMFYLMSYHPIHHLNQIKTALAQLTN
jgi:uncharacterized damage-inducible protein DinB